MDPVLRLDHNGYEQPFQLPRQAAWRERRRRDGPMPDDCQDVPCGGRRKAWFALMLAPLLGGCVAAALAVPALTATGVLTRRSYVRAATAPDPAPRQTPTVHLEPYQGEQATLTPLVELPLPAGAMVDLAPWQTFIDYALRRGGPGAGTAPTESALLVSGADITTTPRRRPCRGAKPAVLVDLDTTTVFGPDSGSTPLPGLAKALARLREAEITVLWISQLPAARVNDVAAALRSSGLDPTGQDPLLLVRHAQDRKQILRQQANDDVCILAIAGDRRSDFDELFDYLRNPESAIGFDSLMGGGWFMVPPPFKPSADAPAGASQPVAQPSQ